MPKVSIIVPVYNVEKYLPECLDSILKQTLADIEIICVDDGSTDGCVQILDDYAKKDRRIVVVHQTNAGYGRAINAGIDTAKGEYIGIVESDDMVLSNMYERLYKEAIIHDLDMVKGECYFCWEALDYRIPYHLQEMEPYFGVVLTEEDREKFFRFFMNVWSGIYRRSFLEEHHIRVHETAGASYQDNGFWIQTMYHAKRAMWIGEPLYLYRQDNEKASVHSQGKEMALLEEYKWAEERLKEQGIKEEELKYCRYFRILRHRGTFIRISDDRKRLFSPIVEEEYQKYGHLISLFNNATVINWYRSFHENPNAFCEELIQRREGLLQRLSGNKPIWIFGATFLAQRTMRILYSMGLTDRLAGFVVSSISVNRSVIGRFPVRTIFDPRANLADSIVILGAKKQSKSHYEMRETLRIYGYLDYLDCEDLLENFYWIY